jgi:hypothetical protein
MDFQISVHGIECSLGKYACVTFTPEAKDPEVLLSESKSRATTVNLVLVLDVSGSMDSNMQHLINSSLAAIDLLEDNSFLKVITFDVTLNHVLETTKVTKDNREEIKKTVRLNIVNRGLCTNLEEPLYECLLKQDQNILLISDGFANRGTAMSSTDLLRMVRSCRNYNYNKFHCLGLQLNSCDLNGTLLHTMASDTDGTYILAHTNDAISTFLGDVLTNHLMVRLSDCNASLKSKDGSTGYLVSSLPVAGFSLRADRTTSIVYSVSSLDGPLDVSLSGCPEPLERFIHTKECPVLESTDVECLHVFKALAASILQETGYPRVSGLIQELNERILAGQTFLVSIMDSLNAVLIPSSGEANQSNHMHSLSAASNQETDVVHFMRQASRFASQSQASDPS